ncbi:serine/arginine repetitive matrix protein 2-like isoform X3 [Homalodisca vitripennis]|uniref:serine/arginine repetitive matrix protein 2-like isoform X3 n=1 Tax=Homalodisca vitripennis TaxID=197043 RepID=UPI001EEC7E8D|nr:serine/arginine repetitive matrix protein 2-like isoform X3 [Homalodisca vitripennis]
MQGYIVVITRNGSLGGRYPVTSTECVFGHSITCDVRVFVANVARKHCVITAESGKPAYIRNFSPSNTTLVNGNSIEANQYELKHADIITVGDRHFRWEYPISSKPLNTPKSAKKGNSEGQMSMVQMPMAVYKNRHSSFGSENSRVNRMISMASQGEKEPNPKRRKTIHNVTDLSVENNSTKPVNKRLLAVTQPASSPKSFNTFKVLLKSANKRKSIRTISKTPKPPKKIISTKIRRAKSLSPSKQISPKKMSKEFDSKSGFVSKSSQKDVISKEEKKQNSPQNISNNSPLVDLSSLHENFTPKKVYVVKSPKGTKSPSPKQRIGTKRKSTLATPLKIKTPKLRNSPKSLQKKTLSTPETKRKSLKLRTPTPDKNSGVAKRNTPKLAASAGNTRKSNTLLKNKSPRQTPKTLMNKSQTSNKGSPGKRTPETSSKPSPHEPPLSSPKTSVNTPFKKLRGKASLTFSSKQIYSPEKSPHNSQPMKAKVSGTFPQTPKEISSPRKPNSAQKSFSPKGLDRNTPTKNKSPAKITGHESPVEKVTPLSNSFSLTPQTPKMKKGNINSSKKFVSPDKSPPLTRSSKRFNISLSRSHSQSSKHTPKESRNNSLQNKTPILTSPKNVMNETSGRTPKSRSESIKEHSFTKSGTSSNMSRDSSLVEVSFSRKNLSKTPTQEFLSINLTVKDEKPDTTRRRKSKTSREEVSVSNISNSPLTPTSRNCPIKDSSPATTLSITPKIDSFPIQEISLGHTPKQTMEVGTHENTSKIFEEDISSSISFTSKSLTPKSRNISPANLRTPNSSETNSHTPKMSITQEKRKSKNLDSSVLDYKTDINITDNGNENVENYFSKTIFSSRTNSPINDVSVVTPVSNGVRPNKASTLRKSFTASLLSKTADEALEGENPAVRNARRSALRSGLSSSRKFDTSVTENSSLKSSMKKSDLTKLQNSTKRKFETDFEARAERAAKRLKMETPRSLSKNKVAALLVCHGRSPKNIQRKPLFSEVLKSHLSAAKQKKSVIVKSAVVVKKQSKQKVLEPALEVPKTFNFNSTGHANSPETIVITKKVKKTPVLKTRKGRKSGDNISLRSGRTQNLEGVQELFQTPSKLIVSSLKTATSIKKPQNVRVRFSLQNDVQSPSGRRSLAMQQEEVFHFGSPVAPPMRYIGTPRPPKISEHSLLHTSIAEESPLAQEMCTTEEFNLNSSKRKSKRSSLASLNESKKSLDFSLYSPSSPTLQFSQISGISNFARKSIDFSDFSPESESIKSTPKLKPSMPSLDDSVAQSSSHRRFSFASSVVTKSPIGEFDPSPNKSATLSRSDLFGSSPDDTRVSRSSRGLKKFCNDNSINTSGVLRFSPNNSEISTRSSKNISQIEVLNVSQIPLPSSPFNSKHSPSVKASTNSPHSKSSESMRSTRSTHSIGNFSLISETPKSQASVQKKRSRSSTLNDTYSEKSPDSSNSSKVGQNSNILQSISSHVIDSTEVSKRISSTPKFQSSTSIYSPVSSPILSSSRRSLRNQSLVSVNEHFSDVSDSKILDESTINSDLIMEGVCFKTPLSTPGKRTRKRSARMYASNSLETIHTSNNQLPIAAVKPSARKNQDNESASSIAESVSLPDLDIINDVSGRSLDRSLAQKILDSRVSSGFDQPTGSDQPSMNSNSPLEQTNLSGSIRRKRKSLASTSRQTLDTTSFDFNSAVTPIVPKEMFVSPLEKEQDGLVDLEGVKRVLNPKANSPVSSYVDVKGIRKLLKTPQSVSSLDKVQDELVDLTAVKRVLNPKANSPLSSYVDVKGVKRLLKTPQQTSPIANYTNVEGIKDLFKTSPVADYTNVLGVKRIYGAPPEPNYMNVKGVRRIFKESKSPNSPDVTGVEVLFDSPKKGMDEFNQPSTCKPVGMVPPMSRLNSNLKNVSGNETVENTESVPAVVEHIATRRNNTRQNKSLTSHLAVEDTNRNENVPSVRTRKTRRKEHIQAEYKEVQTHNLEEISKDEDKTEEIVTQRTTRGRKPQQSKTNDEQLDQPTKHTLEKPKAVGRRGRPRKNVNNDESKKDISTVVEEQHLVNEKNELHKEPSSTQVDEVVITQDTARGRKTRKTVVSKRLDSFKQEDDIEEQGVLKLINKEIELPKESSPIRVDEDVITKSTTQGKKNSKIVVSKRSHSSEQKQGDEAPSHPIGRRTRGKPEVPIYKEENKSILLGKRKAISNHVDTSDNQSPRKKTRGVKQKSKESEVEVLQIDECHLRNKTNLKSKEATVNKKSSEKIRKSPGSTRTGRLRKDPVEEVQEKSKLGIEISHTEGVCQLENMLDQQPNNCDEKSNSPEKTSKQSQVMSRNRSRRDKVEEIPVKAVESKRASRLKRGKESKSAEKDIKLSPIKTKTRGKKVCEDHKLEIPESVEPSKLNNQSLEDKKSEKVSDSFDETLKTSHVKAKKVNKGVNVETKSRTATEIVTSRNTRRGKTEVSHENLKKRGRKEELISENKLAAKLNEEVLKDRTTETPSRSRGHSKTRQEIQQTSRGSRRVKFNTASVTMPEETTQKPATEKKTRGSVAKAGSAVKFAVKRKSISPVKSSPPKRKLRGRK